MGAAKVVLSINSLFLTTYKYVCCKRDELICLLLLCWNLLRCIECFLLAYLPI